MPNLTVTGPQESARKRGRELKAAELPRYPTVIALDPGGTTGWSLMTVHPAALCDPSVSILSNIELWTHGQIECNKGAADPRSIESAGCTEIISLLAAHPGAALVWENFVIRRFDQSWDFLSPVRIMSVLDHWCWRNRRSAFRQMPAEAKTTATDDRLKRWGLYSKDGGMNHARDADRHAITFLRKAKQKPSLRAEAWPHLYSPGKTYGARALAPVG